MVEAEATLDAIRTGQVDAIVISGPQGTQTRMVEDAHPYFVLLDAMGDGAVLLATDGAILFGNRSFEQVDAKSAGAGTGGATTVLMAIVTDLTDRKAAEVTRGRLIQQVISAEDDERRRVARELHDETGQSLAALLVGLRAIAGMSVRPEVRKAALRLRDVAAHTVDDVGRLARGLHPAVLDDMGLAAAAQRHAADFVQSFATPVEFNATRVDTPRLSPLAASTMYRILQEALTNVARYASAQKVIVALTRDEATLALSVRDDGVGFNVRTRTRGMNGLGLRSMMERVTLLGGSLEIESQPGHGTEVRARIPSRT